jgi:hypothetical protein
LLSDGTSDRLLSDGTSWLSPDDGLAYANNEGHVYGGMMKVLIVRYVRW